MKMFEYHWFLIPILSFTNEGIDILVRIKGRAETSDFIVWVYHRLSDQEDQEYEAPYRQRGTTSGFQAMALMRDYSHTNIF